jgi:hypothetical protein
MCRLRGDPGTNLRLEDGTSPLELTRTFMTRYKVAANASFRPLDSEVTHAQSRDRQGRTASL